MRGLKTTQPNQKKIEKKNKLAKTEPAKISKTCGIKCASRCKLDCLQTTLSLSAMRSRCVLCVCVSVCVLYVCVCVCVCMCVRVCMFFIFASTLFSIYLFRFSQATDNKPTFQYTRDVWHVCVSSSRKTGPTLLRIGSKYAEDWGEKLKQNFKEFKRQHIFSILPPTQERRCRRRIPLYRLQAPGRDGALHHSSRWPSALGP